MEEKKDGLKVRAEKFYLKHKLGVGVVIGALGTFLLGGGIAIKCHGNDTDLDCVEEDYNSVEYIEEADNSDESKDSEE